MPKLRDEWEERVKQIEVLRRNASFDGMSTSADTLMRELAGDESLEAHSCRSRIYYELSMAQRNLSEAAVSNATQYTHFKACEDLTLRALEEAEKAGDALDALFVLVNLAGYSYRGRGNLTGAFEGLSRVSVAGEKGAKSGGADADRYLRCMLNADRFMARIYCQDMPPKDVSASDLRRLCDRMKNNPILAKMPDTSKDIEMVEEWLEKNK